MEFLTFPIAALGFALICLIGVTVSALTMRASLRARNEQLVVARAQAYAMLELSQAGVLFIDRDLNLMGDASAVAPELLGHPCNAGTPFVQVLVDLVSGDVRRAAIEHLDMLWKADPTAVVDATANPLARVHSRDRHLAIRFSRLVVDGLVHHIIMSVERVSAPRLVPATIEVPMLDEDTFARRLAGETGAHKVLREPTISELPAAAVTMPATGAMTSRDELGPLDVTEDSLPSVPRASVASVIEVSTLAQTADHTQPTNVAQAEAAPANATPESRAEPVFEQRDGRMNELLEEVTGIEPLMLEQFLLEAREKAGQLRAIIRLPAREPQAFREKLVLILEMIRGIHARAERLPLPSVIERAQRFEQALGSLRDKPALSGNDFLPLAVKLDDLLIHLAMQGEVVTRLQDWRAKNGASAPLASDNTVRSATLTGTTIRQPRIPREGVASSATTTVQQPALGRGREMKLSGLTRESLEELGKFLADMYGKRVSVVVVGLEDVPRSYIRMVEKILVQLVHNAIRHGVEPPTDRAVDDKPEFGTIAVQFARAGADGYQLSVQDDGRGLDHERIRAEAVRQGVLTADVAATIDARKLSGLIFRAGFTTVEDGGARGLGMEVVRDLVSKAGGRVGIATKPGEYTRFRITLPHEKKASDAAVA